MSNARTGLIAALIPLGFLVGFIIATANQPSASPLKLVVIALAGAAVPFTVMLFAAARCRTG